MKIFNTNKNYRGFTLIELMIVILIASIIMLIAYPNYKKYVIKARRADATSTLLQASQFMERFFTENGRYHQDSGGTAFSLPARFSKSPQEGTTTFYTIATTVLTATTFTLTATPVGDQLASDTQCGVLTLDHTGVKCISGGSTCSNASSQSVQEQVNDCW